MNSLKVESVSNVDVSDNNTTEKKIRAAVEFITIVTQGSSISFNEALEDAKKIYGVE